MGLTFLVIMVGQWNELGIELGGVGRCTGDWGKEEEDAFMACQLELQRSLQ